MPPWSITVRLQELPDAPRRLPEGRLEPEPDQSQTDRPDRASQTDRPDRRTDGPGLGRPAWAVCKLL